MNAENRSSEVKRRGGRRKPKGKPRLLAEVPGVSANDGTKQIGTSRKDCQQGNSNRKPTSVRDSTAGKILERLEALEKRHLEYVHAHQSRLKARLGESEKAEHEFVEETKQIKHDIYHLARESGDTAEATDQEGLSNKD